MVWNVEDFDQMLLEMQFYLNPNKLYIERTAANVLDIFSYVGGLTPVMYMMLSFVGSFFSNRAMEAKLIRTIYFINKGRYNAKQTVVNLLDQDQGIIG